MRRYKKASKNKNHVNAFRGSLTVLVFAAVTLHGMVYLHEQAHAQVYEDTGCEKISIDYEYFDLDHKLAYTEALCEDGYEDLRHEKIHDIQEVSWIGWALMISSAEILILYLS